MSGTGVTLHSLFILLNSLPHHPFSWLWNTCLDAINVILNSSLINTQALDPASSKASGLRTKKSGSHTPVPHAVVLKDLLSVTLRSVPYCNVLDPKLFLQESAVLSVPTKDRQASLSQQQIQRKKRRKKAKLQVSTAKRKEGTKRRRQNQWCRRRSQTKTTKIS